MENIPMDIIIQPPLLPRIEAAAAIESDEDTLRNKYTKIHHSIRRGNTKEVEAFIALRTQQQPLFGSKDGSLLHTAVSSGNPDILEILLRIVYNNDKDFYLDDKLNTPLHTATIVLRKTMKQNCKDRFCKELSRCIRVLTDKLGTTKGAINKSNANGKTPLHYLASCHQSGLLNTQKVSETEEYICKYNPTCRDLKYHGNYALDIFSHLVEEYDLEIEANQLRTEEVEDSISTRRIPLLNFVCGFDCPAIVECFLNVKVKDTKCTLNLSFEDATPIKCAVLGRQPNVVEILCRNELVNLKAMDSHNRFPLYYAAIDGQNEKGNRCLDTLLVFSRLFGKDGIDVQKDIFDELGCDGKKEPSIFQYVQKNCVPESTLLLLNSIPDSYWKTKLECVKQLYKSPAIMKKYLDQGFKYYNTPEAKNKFTLTYDFSDILKPSQTNKQSLTFDSLAWLDRPNVEEPESRFLKIALNSSLLRNNKLLKEAVSSVALRLFIVYKYQKLKNLFFCAILIQMLWIGSVTFYLFNLKENRFERSIQFLAPPVLVLIYCIISTFYEMYELWKTKCAIYRNQATNYAQLFRNALLITSTICYFSNSTTELVNSSAAVGSFLAYILAMRHANNTSSRIAKSIGIFWQVFKEIAKVLASYSIITYGTLQVTQLLFIPHSFNNGTQNGTELESNMTGKGEQNCSTIKSLNMTGAVPIYKLFRMMAGETNFDEFSSCLEFVEPYSWEGVIYSFAKNFVFSFILVGLAFAFFNQLTGVALDKVKELQEMAETQLIVFQIDYIYWAETLPMLTKWKFNKSSVYRLCEDAEGANYTAVIDVELALSREASKDELETSARDLNRIKAQEEHPERISRSRENISSTVVQIQPPQQILPEFQILTKKLKALVTKLVDWSINVEELSPNEWREMHLMAAHNSAKKCLIQMDQ